MAEQDKSNDNVERLLAHLKDGSLAKRLVQAHGEQDRARALMRVITNGLEEVRKRLDGSKA
jgi:hypothetical protein